MTKPAATILIVDDEANNRKLLETLLRAEGYLTRSAASGEEALASVAERAPDLILLDVMMPGVDGFQVAKKIKTNPATSNIPIIIVTASVDRSSRMAGLDAGAEDFLVKPIDRTELSLRVRNLLRLKEFGDFLKNHSTILEQQVQERTETLRESERRFSDMLRNVELASVMLDREALVTFCNDYLLRLTGWRHEEVIGRNWFELFIPSQSTDEKDFFAKLLANAPEAWHRENEILTSSGESRLMRWSNSVLRSAAGDVIGSASIGEDITEQRRAETGIKRLNRVYAVLSGINMLIVRVRDRDELFRQACRIAIEAGGFRLVWIGVVDKDAAKIVPVASAGEDAVFFDLIRERLSLRDAAPAGYGPAAMAVREKQTVVVNDVESDSRVLHKKAHADQGIRSLVALPLLIGEEVVAVLGLHASEAGYFDEAELKLLHELAGDISFAIDHIEKNDKLNHLAHYDALTGLPNRTLFYETLNKTLTQASKSGWLVAVLCVDLDHFKKVNDTLGHAIGDELLRQFSDRLVQCLRIRDTVGRLGGDEFAVILVMQDNQKGATLVANKIRDALRTPFDLKGNQVAVTASIGITVHQGTTHAVHKMQDDLRASFDLKGNEIPMSAGIGIAAHPEDSTNPDTLMKFADTAMYRAKQAGRDTYRFFTTEMNAEVIARLDLESALRKAVENNEFLLHYQPKVQLDSGRISGLEALLRWQRPGHGLISPATFIPILEEIGLIVRVGSWVIAEACSQIGLWMRSTIGPVQVSVNVSSRQFIEGDLHENIVKALADNGVPAKLLELELTESTLMVNTERTVSSLQNIKKLGVQISIDDFGTGYSSLAYLRRFPLDKLKIDIAFIRDVTSNPDDAAIVLAIISLAHSLKLEVIAEGVETASQLAYLRRHHCDQMQGYYFSRPLAVPELESLLREEKRLPVQDAGPGSALKTLLLVDDEADILTELQRPLHQDGYHILLANSATEGFELLAQHQVHVILCDQRMPTMSGTAFLDRVKDMYPNTIRIVLSGNTDLESIMDAINRGAVHRYYAKPWDDKLLRDNIREAFRHYSLLHDNPLRQARNGDPAPGGGNTSKADKPVKARASRQNVAGARRLGTTLK